MTDFTLRINQVDGYPTGPIGHYELKTTIEFIRQYWPAAEFEIKVLDEPEVF